MSAAVIIAAKRRRMIRRFREAGATQPEFACRPQDLGLSRSWLFERMVDRGVFVLVADGRFFLDEAAAQQWRQGRRARAVIALVIFLVIFLFMVAAHSH
jgi:hypothetical protein